MVECFPWTLLYVNSGIVFVSREMTLPIVFVSTTISFTHMYNSSLVPYLPLYYETVATTIALYGLFNDVFLSTCINFHLQGIGRS